MKQNLGNKSETTFNIFFLPFSIKLKSNPFSHIPSYTQFIQSLESSHMIAQMPIKKAINHWLSFLIFTFYLPVKRTF